MTKVSSLLKSLEHRSSGWWYPWAFVAAFLVVIAMNGLLITMATSSFPGLVSEHAYEDGLAYNQAIAMENIQKSLGWTGTLNASNDPPSPDTPSPSVSLILDFTLSDQTGAPLSPKTVSIILYRSGHQRFDQTVSLPLIAPGHYQAKITLPVPGRWSAQLTVSDNNTILWRLRRNLFLPFPSDIAVVP